MTSTIPAELLELRDRFETWRTNRKYVREPIPDDLWKSRLAILGCHGRSLGQAPTLAKSETE